MMVGIKKEAFLMSKQTSNRWGQIGRIAGAVALAALLAGCVAEVGPGRPGGGGWCWWHPHRC